MTDFNQITKLLYIFLLPFYWLVYLIPKKKNVWIFGAWNGIGRGDNSEAFFNYIIQYHPEIMAVWLTKSRKVFDYFNNRNCQVYYINSLKAAIVSAIAKIAIINCYKHDFNRFFLNRTNIIQLWHGTPLKKIENDVKLLNSQRNRPFVKIKQLIFPFLKEKYHYIISTSEETSKKLTTAFQQPLDKIIITGYPRNDVLFNTHQSDNAFLDKIKSNCNFKFLILFTPTFRDSDKESLQMFDTFGVHKIENFLKSRKAILVIKGHLHSGNSFQKLFLNSSQIHVAMDDDIPDVNSFLPNVDILLTDYSSIFFDFLLLGRPIIFTPFDLQSYLSHDREMYYDYDEITPGPKAHNWEEVMDCLHDFMQNPDLFSAERERIKNQFNQFCDNKSSERLYEKIVAIL